MPTENPFPLNIADKQDSWEKLQLTANVPDTFKYSAAEWNKVLQALQYLYENIGGGGGGGVQSVSGDGVDNADPLNPVMDLAAYALLSDIFLPTSIQEASYYWLSAYTYKVVYVKWLLNGQQIISNFNQNITLGAADGSNDRIDIIALNIDTGLLQVVPGDPDPQPSLPELAENLLMVTFIPVAAGSSAPDGVSNESIYLENTEWVTSVIGSVYPNDVSNPISGSISIFYDDVAISDRVTLTRASAIACDGATGLLLKIKLSAAGNQNKFKIVTYSDTETLGAIPIEHNLYGFNKNITTVQEIVIPAADLGLVSGASFKRLDIASSENNLTAYVDDVILQFGTEPSEGNGDFLPTGGYQGTAQDLYNLIQLLGVPTEEQIKGTSISLDETDAVADVISLDLTSFTDAKININSADIDLDDSTGRPSEGESFTRTFELTTTNGTEAYGLPLDWVRTGEQIDATKTNYIVVKYSYPTGGALKITYTNYFEQV